VFAEVPVPITTHYKDALDGTARELQDLYVSPGSQQMNDITQTSTWAPPYGYVPDSAASVPTIVGACAGVGKLNL
jgi:pectate lyase